MTLPRTWTHVLNTHVFNWGISRNLLPNGGGGGGAGRRSGMVGWPVLKKFQILNLLPNSMGGWVFSVDDSTNCVILWECILSY